MEACSGTLSNQRLSVISESPLAGQFQAVHPFPLSDYLIQWQWTLVSTSQLHCQRTVRGRAAEGRVRVGSKI